MKKIFSSLSLFLFAILLPLSVHAVDPLTRLKNVGDVAEYATGEDVTVENFAAKIINAFLSILGTLFLAYMIYGGYTWMKAGGNEEDINKAKKILTESIIGISVVMAAYAISYFIASSLENAALK